MHVTLIVLWRLLKDTATKVHVAARMWQNIKNLHNDVGVHLLVYVQDSTSGQQKYW